MAYLVHVGADELHRLIQGVGVAGASVQNHGSDGDVGQDVGVFVDQVEGVEHGLQPLDAFLFLDGSARKVRDTGQVFVHGEQTAEDNVTWNADQLMATVVLVDVEGDHLASAAGGQQQQQQAARPQMAQDVCHGDSRLIRGPKAKSHWPCNKTHSTQNGRPTKFDTGDLAC
jgi:hypothetical protein